MNVTWGFPIWVYLWLCGMAAGAYFAAFLNDQFRHNDDRQLSRLAIYLGVPLEMIGVLFLIVDLGHPFRFWHLLTRFSVVSPMSIGGWILLFGIGTAVLIIVLHLYQRRYHSPGLARTINWLYWVNLVLCIFLMSYTGVLLAASNQPLWMSTILLPALFVISAVSTGIAMLVAAMLLKRSWVDSKEIIIKMIKADAVIIAIELVVMVVYMFWLSQTPISGANEAMERLTTGVLAVRFWIGVILLAILVPFALDVAHWSTDIKSHRLAMGMLAISSICVIAGGLVLRAVWVIGGQM